MVDWRHRSGRHRDGSRQARGGASRRRPALSHRHTPSLHGRLGAGPDDRGHGSEPYRHGDPVASGNSSLRAGKGAEARPRDQRPRSAAGPRLSTTVRPLRVTPVVRRRGQPAGDCLRLRCAQSGWSVSRHQLRQLEPWYQMDRRSFVCAGLRRAQSAEGRRVRPSDRSRVLQS